MPRKKRSSKVLSEVGAQSRSGGELRLFKVIPSGLKYIDIQGFSNYSASFDLLNDVVNGYRICNRLGNKVVWHAMYVRAYFLQNNNSVTGTSAIVTQDLRTIILYDCAANGALPLYSDVLSDNLCWYGAVNSSSSSHYCVENRDRFLILMDDYRFLPYNQNLSSSAAPTNSFPSIQCNTKDLVIEKDINLKGLTTSYIANGYASPLVLHIGTGSIMFLTISDYDELDSDTSSYNLFWKVRFIFSDC